MIRSIFIAVLLTVVPALHASSVFNFDNDALGTYTPFTDVNNGVSATFTSNGDPGGFEIQQSFLQNSPGNFLIDPGPAYSDGLSLTVSFSNRLSSVSLDFGINSLTSSDTFTLSAYLGSALVGTDKESGSVPSGSNYPQGVAAFNGGSFNSIVLTSTGLDLSVDNVVVSNTPVTATPEPGMLPVLGLVVPLCGAIVYRRKAFSARA